MELDPLTGIPIVYRLYKNLKPTKPMLLCCDCETSWRAAVVIQVRNNGACQGHWSEVGRRLNHCPVTDEKRPASASFPKYPQELPENGRRSPTPSARQPRCK
ncbi:hypothetical protein AAY473_037757 [Plecturocebus cupreus]